MHPRGSNRYFFESLIFSELFLAIMGVVVAFILFTVIKGTFSRINVNREVIQLQKEIESLEGNNKELKSLLAYLSSEDFVKQEGREKFGLKDPGEQVVVLNQPSTVAREIVFKDNATEGLSNPQKWLRYFFASYE